MSERIIRRQAVTLLALLLIAALIGKKALWLFILLSAGALLTGIALAWSILKQVRRKVNHAEKNHQ